MACPPADDQNGNNWQLQDADLTTGFHTYAVKWTPSTLTWYLDGVQTHSAPAYPTDNQPMFMLLQEWVGGWTFNPDDTTRTRSTTRSTTWMCGSNDVAPPTRARSALLVRLRVGHGYYWTDDGDADCDCGGEGAWVPGRPGNRRAARWCARRRLLGLPVRAGAGRAKDRGSRLRR